MNSNHNIIYVGRFDRNKNVLRLMEAVLSLVGDFADIRLHLVGGAGEQEAQVKGMAAQHPTHFVMHGPIYDKDRLRELYNRCALFVMVSHSETFGLVYVEAMSQNLPVVYTKGQAIDGLFDGSVGEGVVSTSTASIADGIRRILTHPEDYAPAGTVDFARFDWNTIAAKYMEMYNETARQTNTHNG